MTARHDLMRPDPDHIRCCICFEARKVDELYRDDSGQLWDLCAEDLTSCAILAGAHSMYMDRTFHRVELREDKVPYKSREWWLRILRDEPRPRAHYAHANLVSSKTHSGLHRPVIDLDKGYATVESTTAGHGHLYLHTPMRWWRYVVLLIALRIAGVIELGFLLHSLRRGATYVRLPHIRKEL